MKQALIDPATQMIALTGWEVNPDPKTPGKYVPIFTPIADSARVCQVVDAENLFPVAAPFFWFDCGDDIVADQWYYNTQTQQIIVMPEPAPFPGTTGTQSV